MAILLLLLLLTGCAKGNYARDYFGASHGPVGVDVCMDFEGNVTDKNYVVVRDGLVVEKYMPKESVVELFGQPDERTVALGQQERWRYQRYKLNLTFDGDYVKSWQMDHGD